MVPYALATLVAVVVLLVSERYEFRSGVVAAKVVASSLFVAAALRFGFPADAYGRSIVGALVCGWLGDLFLLTRRPRFLLPGVASFLVGHLAFATAFLLRGVDPVAVAGAVLVLAWPTWRLGRYFSTHAGGGLGRAVSIYTAVLAGVVALAVGVGVGGSGPLLPGAALSFFFSDFWVARQRFVRPAYVNRLLALPTYFLAQLLFASTVGA